VLATLYIRSKTRKETASEKLSRHWLDVKMTRKKEQVETSMALIFGADIQSSQHKPAQRLPSFPGTPNDRKTAPAFLPPGPKLNSANTAPSNAFLTVSSSFFTCSAPHCVAGLLSPDRLRFPYTASFVVALAAQHAGRPDLIRSPKRVLAHTWEGF
jgi:hypothetical protein